MTRQRRSFRRNSFHQVAVRNNCIVIMIDEALIGLIKFCGEMSSTHSHSDTVGKALAQGTGGYLDAGCQSVLGMAGSFRTPLPEVLKFFHWQVVAGQMKQRVEQHRTVAGRQQKSIAVFPFWISRVVSKKTGPQHIGHRRCAEW